MKLTYVSKLHVTVDFCLVNNSVEAENRTAVNMISTKRNTNDVITLLQVGHLRGLWLAGLLKAGRH
jgi:hypothetical protein